MEGYLITIEAVDEEFSVVKGVYYVVPVLKDEYEPFESRIGCPLSRVADVVYCQDLKEAYRVFAAEFEGEIIPGIEPSPGEFESPAIRPTTLLALRVLLRNASLCVAGL